ncbi:regulatory protein, tetR family [Parafrankia irregularis]|uniref:Regulatory protein, tetR family n=1 Tax=Parafrankia irregularis TaxID=795642 RepID=A0A0S4QR79_9ACTN|nr:TetR family transcriptional regulator [Parafrankia sp. CH37]MBE3200636.1 TetR/AcrR family transcriptional regulator [Parafrankia sp. CH37]CUU56970.1 regulatory protein, tetR family [Parafrankia irregularis]
MTVTERPLAEAKRQAALDHVLTAARRFVIENSLDATMDQLAEASGVSRRTLFRLFGTREKLIASGFRTAMDAYLRELPAYEGGTEHWLRATCEAAHRMNDSIGPGYWELASRSELPPDLAAVQADLLHQWHSRISEITQTLWQASGGGQDPPAKLVTTVSAHLSSHFTAAVVTDARRDWQTASALAYEAILTTLRQLTA